MRAERVGARGGVGAEQAVDEVGKQARDVADRTNERLARLTANVKRPVGTAPSPFSRARLATSRGRKDAEQGKVPDKSLRPARHDKDDDQE